MEFGFRIALVRGILDSLSCIPDFKAQVPDSTSKISPESGFPYIGRYTVVFSVVTHAGRCGEERCVTTLNKAV